jgi:hypothetical protein
MSGTVRDAFARRGHSAVSCDLKPSLRPAGEHIQGDVIAAIVSRRRWALIVIHPDCTALAASGNRWYAAGTPGAEKRYDALQWTKLLWDVARDRSDHVALENPIGVLSGVLGRPAQIVQPWQFGHAETKATCLWLHGLPPLTPTDIMPPPHAHTVHRMPPGPRRKELRSLTYPGIAEAMAVQWTPVIGLAPHDSPA